jgi:anti-sigma B factor antagonist
MYQPVPADDPPFSALVTQEAGRAIVYVRGDMDLCSAPAFGREVVVLLGRSIDAIAIDLHGLSFIDSSGLQALNAIRTEAAAQDVQLTLQGVPRQALRTLEVCGMDGLFTLVPFAGNRGGTDPRE